MTRQAVVTGMIATLPFGGVAWDYGQYALGLERLGFEVTYLEDTGFPMLDPSDPDYGEDPGYGCSFAAAALGELSPGLRTRWHVRAPDGRSFGMPADELAAAVADADIFLNVSGACQLRDDYLTSRCKVVIDTDPGWNHFVKFPRSMANRGSDGIHAVTNHDVFFTYAENLGRADCPLPSFGLQWHATRPPVVLDSWQPQAPGERWTTVMSWANYAEPLVGTDGARYGAKELEFPKIESLPERVDIPLELAAGGVRPPVGHWQELGWGVVDSTVISRTLDDYRSYVQRSRGEVSVAKNAYVATRSGWFSCRSACYLAASRPVVLQDTGFSAHLPTEAGLLAFSSVDEAAAAIEAVEHDYAAHSAAARNVAVEHLSSEIVLADLLEKAGVS